MFASFELIREEMKAGRSFEEARAKVRQSIVFTTHTPVAAGNEVHEHKLLEYMGAYNGLSYEQVKEIGGDPFNMTVAGLRMARLANGRSRSARPDGAKDVGGRRGRGSHPGRYQRSAQRHLAGQSHPGCLSSWPASDAGA